MGRRYLTDAEANTAIGAIINSGRPALVGRFGGYEQNSVMWYNKYPVNPSTYLEEVPERTGADFPDPIAKTLNFNAGVYPRRNDIFAKYCEMSTLLYKDIDIIGYFDDGDVRGVNPIRDQSFIDAVTSPECYKVNQRIITEPFHHPNPWTWELRGRKVLIVYPFPQSIELQYHNRTKLFSDYPCRICMPEFDMTTLRPIQSSAGNVPAYPDWFAALEDMKRRIDEIDFDVALVGAGAYGMHLAKYCKDIGKVGICMASGVQMAFGVYGHRWELNPDFTLNRRNRFWMRPLPEECGNLNLIEDGCYI